MRLSVQWAIEFGALACIGLAGCEGSVDGENTAQQQAALRNADLNEDDVGSENTSPSTAPNGDRSARHLHPVVNCVAPGADGKWVAHFGYDNPHGATVTIDVGPRNMFLRPPFDRGQPVEFAPGESDNVVSVTFDVRRGPLVWKLGRARATAWTNSPPCIPSFAGAASASVLSDSEVTLTWPAATDYTTPSSGIVYDICTSVMSGSCAANFVVVQTTAAGASSAIVSGLAASTAHFFVVRARNAVGNEDTNDMEVSSQTCVTGDSACNGTCTSLASDPANCGSCGNQCQSGASCSAGQCVTSAPVVVALAAGGAHTCALLTDGKVACWGSNASGHLGNGTTTDSPYPVVVSGLDGATAIAAGSHHTCALVSVGLVACWGDNSHGQLGNGTTTGSSTPEMMAVSGSNWAMALATGSEHTCALLKDGTVKCWGANRGGQLGNGTEIDSPVPVAVSDLSGARSVAAGVDHTCVVLNTSRVACWGWTNASPLGAPHTIGSLTPATVSGCRGSIIAAGGYHTCTPGNFGNVYCWGWNGYGQLGDGTTTSSLEPHFALGVHAATVVTAGGAHTCVIETATDRTTKCWGANGYGQLGDGTTTDSSTPVVVPSMGEATDITAGDGHTCAAMPDGTVECWGDNSYGQLGNGTRTSTSTPVEVEW